MQRQQSFSAVYGWPLHKKNMKKHTLLRAALFIAFGVITINQFSFAKAYASAQETLTFKLDTQSYSACAGTKYVLLAQMDDVTAPAPTITSSDENVSSVRLLDKEDPRGYLYEIISNENGETNITVSNEAESISLPVTVTDRQPMALDTASYSMFKGDSYCFMASSNLNDSSLPVPYTSDAGVAKVELVKKIGVGKYLFRVTALQEGSVIVGASIGGVQSVFPVEIKSSAMISDQVLLQNPELPVGCEITSLTNLLNYYGYGVSKTFMADNILGKDTTRKTSNRTVYMANPWEIFVGNPRVAKNGYGCYSPVITNAANTYLSSANSTKQAYNITGSTPAQLYSNLLSGNPVVVWATMEMVAPTYNTKWIDIHSGKRIQWIGKEHCLVLIGVTDTTVTMMDPLLGIESYNRSLFELRYNQVGRQAVIIH